MTPATSRSSSTAGARPARRLALLLALLVGGIVGAWPDAARAQKPTLAVVPFTGPTAKRAEATVVRALRKKAQLIPTSVWQRAAKKLFAATHSSEDVAAVADDVGAQVVITGIVKKDGHHYELSVSIRDGKSGKTRQRLKYPLSGPKLSAATLLLLSKEIGDAFELVAAGGGSEGNESPARPNPPPRVTVRETPTPPGTPPPPPPATTATPPPATTATPPDKLSAKEGPPASNEPPPPPPPLSQRGADGNPPAGSSSGPGASGKRPRWAPYFDIAAGLSVTGRSFDFDPNSQPRFTSGVVAGVHGDLAVYPFAFSWKRAGGVFAGLGLGATIDKPFWPDSASKQDPTLKFATSELRAEGGLRWNIVLYKPLPRPTLLLNAGGGFHSFSLSKDANGNDVGPPDVSYKYITAGGGMRIHFTEWAAIYATFNYHVVLSTGPISDTATEYGPTKAFGLRVNGGLDFFVYRGLKVGASGFFEQFSLTFTPGAMTPAKAANSGTDRYFGGVILVGYVL